MADADDVPRPGGLVLTRQRSSSHSKASPYARPDDPSPKGADPELAFLPAAEPMEAEQSEPPAAEPPAVEPPAAEPSRGRKLAVKSKPFWETREETRAAAAGHQRNPSGPSGPSGLTPIVNDMKIDQQATTSVPLAPLAAAPTTEPGLVAPVAAPAAASSQQHRRSRSWGGATLRPFSRGEPKAAAPEGAPAQEGGVTSTRSSIVSGLTGGFKSGRRKTPISSHVS